MESKIDLMTCHTLSDIFAWVKCLMGEAWVTSEILNDFISKLHWLLNLLDPIWKREEDRLLDEEKIKTLINQNIAKTFKKGNRGQ